MAEIMIIEGPAAAGKSTYINYLKDKGWVEADPQDEFNTTIQRPRNYGKLENPNLFALHKDISRYLAAWSLLCQGYQHVVIDRGFVSNLVYSYLRLGLTELPKEFSISSDFFLSMEYFEDGISWLFKLYGIKVPTVVNISIRFLLPDKEIIKQRRMKYPEIYPFDLDVEYSLYEQFVSQFLIAQELNGWLYCDVLRDQELALVVK